MKHLTPCKNRSVKGIKYPILSTKTIKNEVILKNRYVYYPNYEENNNDNKKYSKPYLDLISLMSSPDYFKNGLCFDPDTTNDYLQNWYVTSSISTKLKKLDLIVITKNDKNKKKWLENTVLVKDILYFCCIH